ncbi:acyl-CoA mutase large subunit family protein [Streptomyces sp. NPDC005963]|uniref:acyl-CoA mutase large subunit family protein n=1 Tax=Streptomyces sp. NPDC005963 TaxID=3156721 RepID=UPI0033F2C6BD
MDHSRTDKPGPTIEPMYGPSAAYQGQGRLPAGSGGHPFTRRGHPSMDTACPWARRQYTGSGTADESNARYRRLIANGTTDLSVAFDLPTRRGHDSDAPLASGEVGKAGVALDSIDDMRVLFGGIPLDKVSTSMTINAPAALLLLMYQLVAEEHGVSANRLAGTIENDVLKEYIARGTYIFPPKPSLRLTADTFQYCRAETPKWNTISISGDDMAKAGASPAQEIPFTLANGIEYVRAAVAAGMRADDFAPRLSFRLMTRTTNIPEVAKFRAARRIWTRVMKEEFGTTTSLLHRIPPRIASVQLRNRQSKGMERMTDALETAALALMKSIETLGGAADAIEHGYQRSEIEGSAYRTPRETDPRERVVAGADCCQPDEDAPCKPLHVDPFIEAQQTERLAKLRAWRCTDRVVATLLLVQKAAAGTDNVLYPMKEALAAGATVGEVCDVLREVWGTHIPNNAF